MENQLYISAMQSYMLDRNITQDELARSLKVTPSALGKWLLGRNGISARSRKRIKEICGSYFKNHTKDESIMPLVNSLERSALARRDGSPLVGAIEEFRHLVVCKIFEFNMDPEMQRDLVRAVSNIQFDFTKWS